eukprot:evm.model.scf_56EXC.3 EVM.evm.TU.scf_56EXC.3   scf_56EXC:22256-23153(+)
METTWRLMQGLRPHVFVHRVGDLRQLAALKEGADLCYTAMAFSRDGAMLATCSGEPDLRVSIWDWEQMVVIASGQLPAPSVQVSFHPSNSNLVCTTGSGTMAVWKLERLWDRHDLTGHEPDLQGRTPTCHCWSPQV